MSRTATGVSRTVAAIYVFRDLVGRERVRRGLLHGSKDVTIGPRVDIRSPDRLLLGPRTIVDAGVVLHCGGMEWSPSVGGITVGSDSYIGPNCVLFGAAGIRLGCSVLLSPGVVITSHQHSFSASDTAMREQPLRFGEVVLEDDVWIGANATILPGVRIGTGSIVGAGAVVTSDVPGGVVVVGVPARVLHER